MAEAVALNRLGQIKRQLGDVQGAHEHFAGALVAAREGVSRYEVIVARTGRAATSRDLGRLDEADHDAR